MSKYKFKINYMHANSYKKKRAIFFVYFGIHLKYIWKSFAAWVCVQQKCCWPKHLNSATETSLLSLQLTHVLCNSSWILTGTGLKANKCVICSGVLPSVKSLNCFHRPSFTGTATERPSYIVGRPHMLLLCHTATWTSGSVRGWWIYPIHPTFTYSAQMGW